MRQLISSFHYAIFFAGLFLLVSLSTGCDSGSSSDSSAAEATTLPEEDTSSDEIVALGEPSEEIMAPEDAVLFDKTWMEKRRKEATPEEKAQWDHLRLMGKNMLADGETDDPQVAADMCRVSLAYYPAGETYLDLGYYCMSMNDYATAIKSFRLAVELNQYREVWGDSSYIWLAIAFAENDQLDSSLVTFVAAMENGYDELSIIKEHGHEYGLEDYPGFDLLVDSFENPEREDYKLLGVWHACESVGSGYCERYWFRRGGLFEWYNNQMACDERELRHWGTYSWEDGVVQMEITGRETLEGGKLIPSDGSCGSDSELVEVELRKSWLKMGEIDALVVDSFAVDTTLHGPETPIGLVRLNGQTFYYNGSRLESDY